MREQTYRFALDEATTELKDIVTQFEELKARKEHLENVREEHCIYSPGNGSSPIRTDRIHVYADHRTGHGGQEDRARSPGS